MIKLPKTFERNNFVFNCLDRQGNVALFHRKSKIHGYEDFEVVRIQSHNGYKRIQEETNKEIFIKPSEVYPASAAWGKYGLTKKTEDQAREAFKEWVLKYKDINNIIDMNKAQNKESKNSSNSSGERRGRGRPRLNKELVFPNDGFTIKQLAEKNNVSVGYINIHLKPFISRGEVVETGKIKLVKGRGKMSTAYKFVTKSAVKKGKKKEG